MSISGEKLLIYIGEKMIGDISSIKLQYPGDNLAKETPQFPIECKSTTVTFSTAENEFIYYYRRGKNYYFRNMYGKIKLHDFDMPDGIKYGDILEIN